MNHDDGTRAGGLGDAPDQYPTMNAESGALLVQAHETKDFTHHS